MDRQDETLRTLERRLRAEDPRLERALRTGRLPRASHPWVVLLLVLALGTLCGGLVAGHGVVLASGLVAAGVAAHLLDPHPRARGRRTGGAFTRPRLTPGRAPHSRH
ncbi:MULTISPECIES: DUF3040 domain-containing protein [unclassified Streptomyces]|uniref:DUF3040 domain-containing protein n=1 Tax=Streptomyces TaxID=1883 RepID=UPI0010115AD8|nr:MULTISPECIES: DUF3040 domain-containing protein [unclassified Streptomyces]MDT0421741.1 DUF3040 domain-containing protein [Streptomyces sp. DSM 41859]WEH26161.1 DUF3040 domain-containing protein [Streptomyces sp. AM 3-1-1]